MGRKNMVPGSPRVAFFIFLVLYTCSNYLLVVYSISLVHGEQVCCWCVDLWVSTFDDEIVWGHDIPEGLAEAFCSVDVSEEGGDSFMLSHEER